MCNLKELKNLHNDVCKKLPLHNEYVLAHVINCPWIDSNDPEGNRFFKVVRFMEGMSIAERENMINSNPRKHIYKGSDEHGNNTRPYNWVEFGSGHFFGQDVDYWIKL